MRYIVRRLLLALVTLWALATLGFLLVEAIPGDPARQLAGPTASAETVAAIRHAYGFDRPAWDRYVVDGRALHAPRPRLLVLPERGRAVGDRARRRTHADAHGARVQGELLIGIPLAILVTSRKGRVGDGVLVAAAGATTRDPDVPRRSAVPVPLRVPPRLVPARGHDPGAEVLRVAGARGRDPLWPGTGPDLANGDAR